MMTVILLTLTFVLGAMAGYAIGIWHQRARSAPQIPECPEAWDGY